MDLVIAVLDIEVVSHAVRSYRKIKWKSPFSFNFFHLLTFFVASSLHYKKIRAALSFQFCRLKSFASLVFSDTSNIRKTVISLPLSFRRFSRSTPSGISIICDRSHSEPSIHRIHWQGLLCVFDTQHIHIYYFNQTRLFTDYEAEIIEFLKSESMTRMKKEYFLNAHENRHTTDDLYIFNFTLH